MKLTESLRPFIIGSAVSVLAGIAVALSWDTMMNTPLAQAQPSDDGAVGGAPPQPPRPAQENWEGGQTDRRAARIRRFREGRGGREEYRNPEMAGQPMAPENDRPALRAKGINNYLQFAESFVNSLSDPHRAIGLAALGIRDGYRKQGKLAEAIPVFQELLTATKDQTERNIYLFLLRQSYQEGNDIPKFIDINKQIIKENSQK